MLSILCILLRGEMGDLISGSLICSAADEAQVVEWILSFGSSAELLEPAHLREKLREEIDEMRLHYDEA